MAVPVRRDQIQARFDKLKAHGEEQVGFFKNPYDQMGDLANQLTDFNSPFYQQFASFLNKTTPQMGTNTFLSMMTAQGGGYKGSQNLANRQAQAFDVKRRDGINQAVQGFALGNINTAAGLQSGRANAGMSFMNLVEQQRQFNKSQEFSVGDFLGGMFTTGLGAFLGNPNAFRGGGGKSDPNFMSNRPTDFGPAPPNTEWWKNYNPFNPKR